MAIVQRRVFYGKVGTGGQLIEHLSGQLIEHLKGGNELMKRAGVSLGSRVLSDHNSGRTDRVVAEWEMEDTGDFDAALSQLMEDPKNMAEFGPWVEKLNGLIHYAEVEYWHIQ